MNTEWAHQLQTTPTVILRQRRELGELFGFETRNKYSLETESGAALGFAAEQQKGIFGFLLRQFLGHWRRFEIHFFDSQRQLLFRAVHPFRWIFQRLEVQDAQGTKLGALQQRFSIFRKSFDVEDATGQVILQVRSGFLSFWTFVFEAGGRERAVVEKKWSGLLREVFTDSDHFRLRFTDSSLTPEERALLLAAGLFIDLQYFEAKSG